MILVARTKRQEHRGWHQLKARPFSQAMADPITYAFLADIPDHSPSGRQDLRIGFRDLRQSNPDGTTAEIAKRSGNRDRMQHVAERLTPSNLPCRGPSVRSDELAGNRKGPAIVVDATRRRPTFEMGLKPERAAKVVNVTERGTSSIIRRRIQEVDLRFRE